MFVKFTHHNNPSYPVHIVSLITFVIDFPSLPCTLYTNWWQPVDMNGTCNLVSIYAVGRVCSNDLIIVCPKLFKLCSMFGWFLIKIHTVYTYEINAREYIQDNFIHTYHLRSHLNYLTQFFNVTQGCRNTKSLMTTHFLVMYWNLMS